VWAANVLPALLVGLQIVAAATSWNFVDVLGRFVIAFWASVRGRCRWYPVADAFVDEKKRSA
jgi:hypothetical protein